ncbi:hypothetical protein [Clostridium sp. JN-1]|uniref:hypothetical protein n=1 Tax=Clostridium sp. JN-1 TaxID=2483110 RepID=UPI000F0B5306|nr:hypothetical protein [Clostridium sp. JN-1]
MRNFIKQAIKVFFMAVFIVSIYSFASISDNLYLSKNKVYADDETLASTQSNANTAAQSTKVQINGPADIFYAPLGSSKTVRWVKNDEVTVLNKEGNSYYIEYNSDKGKLRGYIDQSYVSPNSNIPVVDHSQSSQIGCSGECVKVYSGPGDDYENDDTISNKTVKVLGKEGSWYFIEYTYNFGGLRRGYISSENVTLGSTSQGSDAAVPSDPADLNTNVKRFLNTARSQIGTLASGSEGNTVKYGEWYGTNNIPWSSTFISWAAYNSGLQSEFPKTSSYSDSMKWFKDKGLWGNTPKIGSIAYLKNNGLQFNGIVESIGSDGTLTLIQGDYCKNNYYQVARVNYKPSDVIVDGYGYPSYPAPTNTDTFINKRISIYAGSSNDAANIGYIDNELVTVLNKEGNRCLVEYNTYDGKKRAYIDASYADLSNVSDANYGSNKQVGTIQDNTAVSFGPSSEYVSNGTAKSQTVTILNKENNYDLVEYKTSNGDMERGYIAADSIKDIHSLGTSSNGTSSNNSGSSGTVDLVNYVYKFPNAIISSYGEKGMGSGGYYCNGNGSIVAAHNMRAGTQIYIPQLKYINSAGIFTVGDTGGPFFDFDINTTQDLGRSAYDVYVLKWGEGPMMQSFESAIQEQKSYGQWGRYQGVYNQYHGQFQTENFRQP